MAQDIIAACKSGDWEVLAAQKPNRVCYVVAYHWEELLHNACGTRCAKTVAFVLGHLPPAECFWSYDKGSYIVTKYLNSWDARGRSASEPNSSAIAAMVVLSPHFDARCDIVGAATNDWQNMCTLFTRDYPGDQGVVVWQAVAQNKNLPDEARAYAERQLSFFLNAGTDVQKAGVSL